MSRTMKRIGLALAAAIMLTAGGPNSTILGDNFNDGNDDGWIHEDTTVGTDWGPAVYDAAPGAYHLQSSAPVPVSDPNAGAIAAEWAQSIDNPTFANGTVRGTFRADTQGSTVGYLLRCNDDAFTDYGFYGSTSFGTFYIERFNFPANPDAPQTIIAMADPKRFPFVVGKTYHVEGSVIGNCIRIKAWEVGRDEPAEAVLNVTDTALSPGSGTTLCPIVIFDPVPLQAQGVTAVQVSGTFDNITFTPAR